MTRSVTPFVLLICVAAGCADEQEGVDPAERLPGGATTNTLLLGSNAFSRHASNITRDNEALFFTGNSFFNQPWVEAPSSTETRDGVGPLFNARSCSACHFRDGRGQPPTVEGGELGLLYRLSVPGVAADGSPLPDPSYGGQLQPFALSDMAAEGQMQVTYVEVEGTYDDGTTYTLRAPTYAIDDLNYGPLSDEIMISARVAPQMIGLGLLEAIPEARLVALADPDDADGDGISGRLNSVWDAEAQTHVVGRFGWKSEQPTVRQQSAGAFLGDMGITSPVFTAQDCAERQDACRAAPSGGEPEIAPHLFDRVVAYSSLLAVPVRRDWDAPDVLRGRSLFRSTGCASCHTPDHHTGEHAFSELSNQHIWPYTDLLLHDMGPGLADDRPVFDASGSEWRTPPLWGIGLLDAVNKHTFLLHDGRARGVAEAILWHGGEAQEAADNFRALSRSDRDALVAFVESL